MCKTARLEELEAKYNHLNWGSQNVIMINLFFFFLSQWQINQNLCFDLNQLFTHEMWTADSNYLMSGISCQTRVNNEHMNSIQLYCDQSQLRQH